MNQDACQIRIIDRERIALARQSMPDVTVLAEATEFFSMLGELSRLRILQALSTTELCVCDLAVILDSSSSAVSHQLRLLRAKGLVRFRKEGKIAYYSLADDRVRLLLKGMYEHAQQEYQPQDKTG